MIPEIDIWRAATSSAAASSTKEISTEGRIKRGVGSVVRARPELGFGFISADTGDELFFHISEIREPAGASMPSPGTRLTYHSVRVPKGLRAIDIEILE